MVVYLDSGWPLWLRAVITIAVAALVAVMAWQYYRRFWKRH